jgi:hypothetical protein
MNSTKPRIPRKLTSTVTSTAQTLTFMQNSQNLFIVSLVCARIDRK